jgi:very-short-patch-repair endonuclease
LREHFRCVPDIIEFSNELCYDLEIRPLRDSSAVPRPYVVEHVVHPSLGTARMGKTNDAEAHSVVALLKAAMEMDEYADKTMGAITLLGDEQADLIQDLAVSTVGAVELERRRFVAGNSAQFQGDERHVIFLSMVDAPTGGLLRLQQTPAFKQRYNVAASRAKDQLWLVHSLDPNRDLKGGDLRRTLIEYVRAPGARRRAAERAERRAESPFEAAVIRRLATAGYHVESQVWIGGYRIDMVVSDGTHHAALECDGDRFHPIDRIPADMARQAVLERVGWRFVRIRGTRFYRHADATMAWVFEELDRLGVEPVGVAPEATASADAGTAEFRDRVVRRAWEIMHEEGWMPAATEETAGGLCHG